MADGVSRPGLPPAPRRAPEGEGATEPRGAAEVTTAPPHAEDDPREDVADRILDRVRRPWLTLGLVAALVTWHGVVGGVLYQRGQVDLVGVLVARRPRPLLRRCGAMASARIEDGELWRLVSSGFLHIDGLHLLLNGLALIALGRICEAVYGATRTLWMFVLCSLCGAGLSWASGNPLSAGASSAVFGFMGAAIVFGWRHGRALPDRASTFFRWKLLPWLILNLVLGFLPFIDAVAHVGGLLGGTAAALLLGNVVVPGPARRVRFPWAMAAATALLLLWAAAGVAGKWFDLPGSHGVGPAGSP